MGEDIKIVNRSNKKLIAARAGLCDSPLCQLKGLMFSAKPRALAFDFKKENKISLHMFFVFFPIDVIFLTDSAEVVELIENFSPFSLYSTRRECRYAIELPAGSISRSKTKIGHKISLVDAE